MKHKESLSGQTFGEGAHVRWNVLVQKICYFGAVGNFVWKTIWVQRTWEVTQLRGARSLNHFM